MTDQDERNAEIVAFRRSGATFEQVGERYGLSREQVRRIVNGPPARGEGKRGRPCPYCGQRSKLLWARDEPDGTTRRRRECTVCHQRWNRVERDEEKIPAPTSKRTQL